jgi:O-methyltransferase involved in polyketide biosynthesis
MDSLLKSLGSIPSTLLIPLAARAQGARWFPQLNPHDLCAMPVLEILKANVQIYFNDWATVLNVLWRTEVIKRAGHQFFEAHPKSTGVNLGSGLSSYFQWLDNGSNHWIDTDLSEVISLRQMCFQVVRSHCQDKTINITQLGWWKRLGLPVGKRAKPVFLICEGVLMYLTPEQVHTVLEEVGKYAPPGSEIIFDVMSPIGVGHAAFHPSVGGTGAEFTWGGNNAEQIATAHPRLKVLSQHSVCEAYGLACCMTELFLTPFTGGPMYGLVHLGLHNYTTTQLHNYTTTQLHN